MEEGVKIGDRAPDFRAVAAGSGREVSLSSCVGQRLVLIFHTQSTAPTAGRINRAVRESYPSPEDVVVASVVDLSFVPPVYWLTVSLIIGQAYERAAAQIPPELDPSHYVIILQDWGGLVSQRFGVRRVGRAAAVVVIDERSEISGFYQGEEPMEAVLHALEGEPWDALESRAEDKDAPLD